MSGLSRGAQELLARLIALSQRHGHAYPSQRYLADRMKAGVRSVKRWTRELKDAGLIEAKRGREHTMQYEPKGQNGPSVGPSNVPSARFGLIIELEHRNTYAQARRKPPNWERYRTVTAEDLGLCSRCGAGPEYCECVERVERKAGRA